MYRARLNRLRKALKKHKTEWALFPDPSDIFYLTGYQGDQSWVVVSPDQSWLITNFIYMNEARAQCKVSEVRVAEKARYPEEFKKITGKKAPGTIGVDPAKISLGLSQRLKKLMPGTKLVNAGAALKKLRAIKEDIEIKKLKKAVSCAQKAFRKIQQEIRPGAVENDLFEKLRSEIVTNGGQTGRFWTIVAADKNAALCHYEPAGGKLKKNGIVLFDFGASVGYYNSDMTRTMKLGQPPAEIKKIYRIVDDARKKAIDAVKPGKTFAAIDAAARDYIESKGYGKYFGHGLGHGIGIDVHEWPYVTRNAKKDRVRKGMVFTIEPGIYLPAKGGVRVEDMVLVTADGARILTSLSRKF